ncbi:MAG: DUF1573 domain-containing protein [Chlorobi bacterium]|nr:DUF1573 domain-containing protein [Chlorobiota bacterium]
MNTQHLLSIALLLALIGFFPLAAQVEGEEAQTTGDGKLEVVDQYDWGTTIPGTLEADIEIKNVGTGQLQIERVKPSCGCTAAPLDDYLLDPGESTTMHVSLNAKNRKGPLRKSITIFSDDPSNPTKFVQLIANIQTDISYNPDVRWLVFNNVVAGKEATTSVRVMNTSDKPVTIYPPEIRGTDAPVSFNLVEEKVLAPDEELELVARVMSEKPVQIEGKVTLKTSSENSPMREFTLHGNVIEAATVDNAANQ